MLCRSLSSLMISFILTISSCADPVHLQTRSYCSRLTNLAASQGCRQVWQRHVQGPHTMWMPLPLIQPLPVGALHAHMGTETLRSVQQHPG
jgi:hypothetical protein